MQILKNINLISNQFYVENNPMNVSEASQNGLLNLITDINITDLGTSPSSFNVYDGATVKGSYNGVLCYNDTSNFNNTEHVVPVPISISFEAFRID